MKAEEPAVQKGLSWLTGHQRESGRWFTESYNNSKPHYITNAGTAYAVMALRAYGK
jgi:squalene-hopene/tetraprenyl-beta-curcumene cyclase